MVAIVFANFGFWFNFLIPVAIALYLALTHKEYIWKEFGIQVGVTFLYVTTIFFLLFSTTVDLIDTEYQNSKAVSFTYYEEWKERVTYTESYSCGTSKSPKTCTRTKTRIDHHSPYYEILTGNDEIIRIKRRDWQNASSEFSKSWVDVYRSNQVSYGDGNKYVSYPNRVIPTAQPHLYENYVTASKINVIKDMVPQTTIDTLVKQGKLREYPQTYISEMGSVKLNRFVDTTKAVTAKYLDQLNTLSVNIGEIKHGNPIFYVTNESRDLKGALSQYWGKGKKNDITVIFGIDTDGKIVWSDVITYTNNTDFIIDMQNIFMGLNINTDKDSILKKFNETVHNSYVRKPMKEFEYLTENIELEWYWQLMIFLGNLVLSGFVMYKMMTNYASKRSYRRY